LVDTRNFTGDGDLASTLRDSFNWILPDHIETGQLPEDNYTVTYVYGATMDQYDGDEETNVNEEGEISEEEVQEEEAAFDEGYEGVVDDEEVSEYNPGYRSYEVLFKAKNSEGKYYLTSLRLYYGKENGEFVLDKSGSWASVSRFKPN